MISPAAFAGSAKSTRVQSDRVERAVTLRRETLHDAGLVRRFNAGDESAFVEIMTRYRERMFAIGLRVVKNPADAEEIVQDTFIRAHRALGRFRGDASLATWLHRIALNLARNRYWYFMRRHRGETVSLDRALDDHCQTTFSDLAATDAAGPAREAAASEFSELVATCMERLEAGPREILILRNANNHSYGEIARRLGIGVGTVKSRIARARENLRVLLTKACPEFGAEARPEAWFGPVRPAGGVEVLCV